MRLQIYPCVLLIIFVNIFVLCALILVHHLPPLSFYLLVYLTPPIKSLTISFIISPPPLHKSLTISRFFNTQKDITFGEHFIALLTTSQRRVFWLNHKLKIMHWIFESLIGPCFMVWALLGQLLSSESVNGFHFLVWIFVNSHFIFNCRLFIKLDVQ